MTSGKLVISYDPWANERGVGQAYVHASTKRFRTVMAGRQSGKTLCGIAEICTDAMTQPGHMDWWVCNNLEVKPRAWRGLLDFLPKEVVHKTNETERRIRLINGSEIYVKSAAGDDSLVSESLDFVVCDEAGLWKEAAWERGVSPMLTARPDARVLMIGTPRSKNWFYRFWLRGVKDRPEYDPEYESFQWKSEDSPYADLKYLAERRRNMPVDLYREEYEADPLDSTSGVFRNVRNCVRTMMMPADPMTVIGADFARKRDFSAFIPMNSARQALAVYRSQEDYPLQRQQLAQLSVRNNFARIIGDEAGPGDPFIQEIRAAGFQVEGVNTNGPMKRTIIDNLRLAFEQGTVSIPNDEVLISELEDYEYEVLPSGALRYSAPDGKHDDTVIALALALWGQRASIYQYAQPNQSSTYMGTRGGNSYMRKSA